MIKVMEQAVEKVKGLSPERQASAAHVLEGTTATGNDVARFNDDEHAGA